MSHAPTIEGSLGMPREGWAPTERLFDWYQQTYPATLERARPTADPRVTLFSTHQPPGRYPDAPCRDFSIQLIENTGVRTSADQGAGRFRTIAHRGSFALAPKNHYNDYQVDDPLRLIVMPLPAEAVAEVAAVEGRGAGEDFGRLHSELVQDAMVSEVVRRLFLANAEAPRSSRLQIDAAVHLIAAALLHRAASRPVPERVTALPDWAVKRVRDLIAADLGRDFALGELAQACGYSAFHFQRGFKAATGRSPHEMQREMRLERAMQLLASSELAVIMVAQESGFDSAAHFATLFKRRVGVTPSAYRRQARA